MPQAQGTSYIIRTL